MNRIIRLVKHRLNLNITRSTTYVLDFSAKYENEAWAWAIICNIKQNVLFYKLTINIGAVKKMLWKIFSLGSEQMCDSSLQLFTVVRLHILLHVVTYKHKNYFDCLLVTGFVSMFSMQHVKKKIDITIEFIILTDFQIYWTNV